MFSKNNWDPDDSVTPSIIGTRILVADDIYSEGFV
jgi:hypothetical protein